MPNLPPDLPAWLDQVEAYCEKADFNATYDALILNPGEFDKNIRAFSLKALTDLPLAVQAIRGLMEALEESVKLQSHYANLLNMHDGGLRLQFETSEAWLKRLAYVKSLKAAKGAAL